MSDGREFRFKIDAYTRETIPMARLAEYMADLAVMLGETPNVHFLRIEDGSAVLIQKIDDVALPKVNVRIREVRDGRGSQGAMKAYHRTNKRLQQDNSIGLLSEEDGAEIIRFPGREEEERVSFGAFNQDGSLDGRIILIGGTGDPVPVHIRQGASVYNCLASLDVATTLGPYMFHYELRVRGTGRWLRDEDGAWVMQRFSISSFQVLDEKSLADVVAGLRNVPGSGWRDVADPFEELKEIRGDEDEAQ